MEIRYGLISATPIQDVIEMRLPLGSLWVNGAAVFPYSLVGEFPPGYIDLTANTRSDRFVAFAVCRLRHASKFSGETR